MDVDRIRSDFPILQDLIYLDSASTSLTPEPVLEAELEYYRQYRANTGRGVYRLAQMADMRYRQAHRKVAGLIGATEEGTTVFTRNSTESINLVSRGLSWKKGDRVVTTLAEHHSNLLPWMRLQEAGVSLTLIPPEDDGTFELSRFEEAVDDSTRLVALAQVSNSLGTVLQAREVGRICREHGSLFLVDGAQSVPHLPVDVGDLGCDFLCFSGHKMLGPSGTGVLWSRDDLEPLMVGGGMVEDVSVHGYVSRKGYEGLEAGTPNIAGGIALGSAADYLQRVGMEEIRDHEATLSARLLQGLKEIEGVEVYGPPESRGRAGIVSFNIRDMNPHQVALMLDEASSIMVRSGHHCCMPLMKHLGLKSGTVRASLYLYNTRDEVESFLQAAEEISRAVR